MCPRALLGRREFLGWCIALLGSLIAVVVGGTGTGYVLSALFQRRQDEWVDLGPITAIPLKAPVKVDFVQRRRDAWITTERRSSTWIRTPNGKDFVAFDPRCTHLGCPYRWDDQQRQFLCPCHTAVFDLNGNVVSGPPPRPLDRYPCKVVADRLFILSSQMPSGA